MASFHRTALRGSIVLLALSVVLFVVGVPRLGGPLLTAFFALAAVGVRGSEKLRGISFSLLILAADVWAILKTIASSAPTGNKVLWIVLIIVLPVLGLILWAIAGPRASQP